MNSFLVCAGWIQGDPVIGECFVDHIRGEEIISFQYDKNWLLEHSISIDPRLVKNTIRQYPPKKNHNFGFLDDISPDRWGKRLIDRSFRRQGLNRSVLFSDYLFGVSDVGRSGGIRLKTPDGHFIGEDASGYIPPITDLRRLETAVRAFEDGDEPSESYLKDLLASGSSLGGARPKAYVKDVDGSMWVAKFPSKNDDYDVGAWEMVAHELAVKCGIQVPNAKAIKISDKGTIFLVRRFDRDANGDRIHYASAMNMLCEYDDSDHLSSYLDILSCLSEISDNFQDDVKQLFERLLFNICIGNTDDHLRNHGFVLTERGWRLSEAFDLNPSTDRAEMSLLVDYESNDKSLNLALSVCEYFGYSQEEAYAAAQRIATIVIDNVAVLAKRYGLNNSDIDLMAGSFTESYRFLGRGIS
ncbi:MAG: HipA domain-containing protein [Saccharofermentans sp.]|nr:HipA domain-containing protein [Saccharofermentans sp.]